MFGEIRTMTDERGETFFVGKDIAEALGYAKPQNALATHVDDDDKTTALIQGIGSNYKTTVVIINESGLYALILSSKLPQAKAFKRWVTSEVLPQIRKTGAYVSQKKQIENLTRHIEELEPKAEYCDEVLESVSCFTTTQIAKELSMTVHDLTRLSGCSMPTMPVRDMPRAAPTATMMPKATFIRVLIWYGLRRVGDSSTGSAVTRRLSSRFC